jgi:F0F1-type ATP synthase membrane subunit b/b'
MIEKDKLQKLLDMKTKLENAKARKSELLGQQKQVLKNLKDDFDCSTLDEAKEKLKNMKAKIDRLETKFKTDLAKLEADYEDAVGAR